MLALGLKRGTFYVFKLSRFYYTYFSELSFKVFPVGAPVGGAWVGGVEVVLALEAVAYAFMYGIVDWGELKYFFIYILYVCAFLGRDLAAGG